MHMHTAGSLQNGRYVWVMAKVDESFTLFRGKDRIENNLLFTLPMIYGKKIDIRFTPVRVVCNNTLNLALQSRGDLAVSLNHRRAFNPNLVKETLGIASDKLKKYEEMAKFLASKKAKEDDVVEYFATLFPATGKKADAANDNELVLSRPARLAMDALETQPGHQYGAGTWWAPFNAVTYNADHVLGHTADTRLTSSWYGANRKKKIEALELALDYANAA
jgi:phage/plasmid-like protein (TIGR03299 family)